MFEWQTIAVGLIILAAAFYTGRMAWMRLRTFRNAKGAVGESACGGCETAKKPAMTERTVFVEIGRSGSRSTSRRR